MDAEGRILGYDETKSLLDRLGQPELREAPNCKAELAPARWHRIPIVGREEWAAENLANRPEADDWQIGYHGAKASAVFAMLALDILLGSKTNQGGSPSEGRDNVPYLGDDMKTANAQTAEERHSGPTNMYSRSLTRKATASARKDKTQSRREANEFFVQTGVL